MSYDEQAEKERHENKVTYEKKIQITEETCNTFKLSEMCYALKSGYASK